MGWADSYIATLKSGSIVTFRPRGHSMTPLVKSGQLCTVGPITPEVTLSKGDIVLCTVHGHQYFHLVKEVRCKGCLIGNNRGHTNGWAKYSAIFGRLIRVDP